MHSRPNKFPPPVPKESNVVVDGYRCGTLLGQDEWSEVFEVVEADGKRPPRPLALKRIHSRFAGDSAYRQRLYNIAERLLVFRHPHAVEVVAFKAQSAEACYLVMERLAGETLDSLLRRGRLPGAMAYQIIRQIGEALQAAHSLRIVHGCLTPVQVLVSHREQGEQLVARLLDFGLAPPLEVCPPDRLGCLAPEQLVTTESGPIMTPKVDQFALAAILYELLAGMKAFPGNSFEQVRENTLRREPRYFELNATKAEVRRINQVLQRALHKSPADRFDTIEAFLEALEPPTARTSPPVPLLLADADGTPHSSSSSLDIPTTGQLDERAAPPRRRSDADRYGLLLWAGLPIAGALAVSLLLVHFTRRGEMDDVQKAQSPHRGSSAPVVGTHLNTSPAPPAPTRPDSRTEKNPSPTSHPSPRVPARREQSAQPSAATRSKRSRSECHFSPQPVPPVAQKLLSCLKGQRRGATPYPYTVRFVPDSNNAVVPEYVIGDPPDPDDLQRRAKETRSEEFGKLPPSGILWICKK